MFVDRVVGVNTGGGDVESHLSHGGSDDAFFRVTGVLVVVLLLPSEGRLR